MKLAFKDLVAVLIALAMLAGLAVMFNAEGNIISGANAVLYKAQVLPALQKYALALGVVFLVVSISYILLGRENDIATTLGDQDKKR